MNRNMKRILAGLAGAVVGVGGALLAQRLGMSSDAAFVVQLVLLVVLVVVVTLTMRAKKGGRR